tara:strand:+ start:383 stop:646 length:264 start_codon:yes stop_codon:yes gene_type:complete
MNELVSIMPTDLLIKIYFNRSNEEYKEATIRRKNKVNMEFNIINSNYIEDYICYHGDEELETFGEREGLIYNYTEEYLNYIKHDQYR